MKFLNLVYTGRNTLALYLGGLATIIVAYILGSLPFVFDLSLNFPTLVFDPNSPSFIATYGSTRFLVAMLLPFIVVFFSLLLYLRWAHKRSLNSLITSSQAIRWKRFFGFAFFLLFFFSAISAIELWFNDDLNFISWNFNPSQFWPLFLVTLFMLPIQAATEELIFRVYLFQGLYLRLKKVWISIFLSSFMFAVMHFSNPEISQLGPGLLLYYFMAGCFLALISIKSEGLELALAFHTVNNLFGALIISSNWQVFHTQALFIDSRPPGSLMIQLATGLFTFCALYFLLALKYKWKAFKLLD